MPPPHASLYEPTAMLVGPMKVELLGVVQSTWNFQLTRLLDVSSATA